MKIAPSVFYGCHLWVRVGNICHAVGKCYAVVAFMLVLGDDLLCSFCRAPAPSLEEVVKTVKKRVAMGDAEGMNVLGCCYNEGKHGLSHDRSNALELWHQAGELGCAAAYYRIGYMYNHGEGVERDKKKAVHYWELAAMRGDANARHNLGCDDANVGKINRALKHFMIATGITRHHSTLYIYIYTIRDHNIYLHY